MLNYFCRHSGFIIWEWGHYLHIYLLSRRQIINFLDYRLLVSGAHAFRIVLLLLRWSVGFCPCCLSRLASRVLLRGPYRERLCWAQTLDKSRVETPLSIWARFRTEFICTHMFVDYGLRTVFTHLHWTHPSAPLALAYSLSLMMVTIAVAAFSYQYLGEKNFGFGVTGPLSAAIASTAERFDAIR